MRSGFGKNSGAGVGGNWESDYLFGSPTASPDQVALVWNGRKEAIAALPVPSLSNPGSFDMDVSRFPADQNLVSALKIRRENDLQLGSFSGASNFLTVANDFTERTRVLALEGEVLALNDVELFEWLVNAEREMYLGTDNHPVFETALEDTACTFTRLPNGQIAMSEVSRESVDAIRGRMRSTFGEDKISATNLRIETPLRCAARYFLTAVPEGAAVMRAGKETELTAFLLIGAAGFSYGLWSPKTGLFTEYAFAAPAEIFNESHNKKDRAQNLKTVGNAADLDNAAAPDRLESYIKNAFEELYLQISPEKLESLEFSTYARVVWATEPSLKKSVSRVAEKYKSETGLDFLELDAPIDETVAGGLLFGSFTFGDDVSVGAEILPPINFARDLLVLADKEEVERRKLEEAYLWKRRNQAVFTLVAAPVFVFACLLALIAGIIAQQTILAVRDAQAEARSLELKPALERRRSYEANLKWYQEFITQVSALRRQQPSGIGMLYKLNTSYPFDIDNTFYVSDLKLNPDATIELTGLARNKDAVTSFIRSLEFAGGAESGSRLFSNLTYEVQEGIVETAVPPGGSQNIPKLTNSQLTGNGPAPGIIAWTIRGNYLPMAEFVPVDPAKAAAVKAANPAAPGAPTAAPPAAPPAPPPNPAVPTPVP